MWDPVKEAKKVFKKLKSDIESAAESGKRAIAGKLDEARKSIQWNLDRAKREIRSTANDAKKELEGIPGKVDDAITDKLPAALEEAFAKELPKALESCLQELAGAVTGEGLEMARKMASSTKSELDKLRREEPELVAEIDQLGGYVLIGPIKLAYSGYYTRIELVTGVLARYAGKPPEFRRQPLIDMVLALGPDTVDCGADVSVNAVVVGSSALRLGGGLNSIRLKLAARLLDKMLKELGVPE